MGVESGGLAHENTMLSPCKHFFPTLRKYRTQIRAGAHVGRLTDLGMQNPVACQKGFPDGGAVPHGSRGCLG